MRPWIPILPLAVCGGLFAQGSATLASEFNIEGVAYQKDCSAFKTALSCAQEIFTGTPVHLTAGSLSPQNGIGFGPAFAFDPDTTNWRLNINADAVVSTNQSWRAGFYLKAAKAPSAADKSKVVVLQHRPSHPLKSSPAPPAPEVNFYAQGISLQQLDFYGLGNSSARTAEALYQMREVIVGGNGLLPLKNSGFGFFGEVNGRAVDIRPTSSSTVPSISQLYNNVTAPGLASQPGFLQMGEGLRFGRTFGSRMTLDYSATIQEFVGGSNSFDRLNLDFSHTFLIYKNVSAAAPPSFGPDGSINVKPDFNIKDPVKKDYHTRDMEGSINFGVSVVQSFVASGKTVPFYFQPTLGGSDVNGDLSLPSYADYRFRAPNLLLFHASVEHTLWGPFGLEFLTQYGMVAQNRGDLAVAHLHHSFAAGLTIHAGGLPEVAILFAWSGHEGTHDIAYINPGLLGGSGRPSLF